MKRPMASALVIGLVQGALIASLAVQAALDRGRLPRAWALAIPVTATPAVHGRYVRLHVVPIVDAGLAPRLDIVNQRTIVRPTPVALEARDGRLLAHKAPASHVDLAFPDNRKEGQTVLAPAVDCFLPPAAGDASQIVSQGALWVEVSVPRRGVPRPLRLGVMKNGRIEPISGQN
jgi:hypothetical protein